MLLVDDDPLVIRILRALLTREGWEVISAESLAQARPLLDGVDAIIVDGLLPDGYGLDLLQEPVVQQQRPRVVLHTGTRPSQPVDVPVVLKGDGAEAIMAALTRSD